MRCHFCGDNYAHHYCHPFCPVCDVKMRSAHYYKPEEGRPNIKHFTARYLCDEHGEQEPVMKNFCPGCRAELRMTWEEITMYVLDPNGNPLPGANVVLLQGDRVLLNDKVNAEGFIEKEIVYDKYDDIGFTVRVKKLRYRRWKSRLPIVFLKRGVMHAGAMKFDMIIPTLEDL
jgi:hypothetical protein